MVAEVRAHGLTEAAHALHDVGSDLQREADEAARRVAGAVATSAASAARSLGGSATLVAPSIKAVDAGVVVGGSGLPMALGAASGSKQYGQFRPYVGTYGYFPYPQIETNEDRIAREQDAALDNTIKRRFHK